MINFKAVKAIRPARANRVEEIVIESVEIQNDKFVVITGESTDKKYPGKMRYSHYVAHPIGLQIFVDSIANQYGTHEEEDQYEVLCNKVGKKFKFMHKTWVEETAVGDVPKENWTCDPERF